MQISIHPARIFVVGMEVFKNFPCQSRDGVFINILFPLNAIALSKFTGNDCLERRVLFAVVRLHIRRQGMLKKYLISLHDESIFNENAHGLGAILST